MMSNKWAFSLTTLITIFALAFVVTPAMAGEFGVSLNMASDISAADGLQLEHPGTDSVTVTVVFDQAVVLAAANVTIDGFDRDGNYDAAVKLAATDPITPKTASQMIMLKIMITNDTTDAMKNTGKITLKIAKGIASASFTNEDTSKELKVDIQLLPADLPGDPTVYSISRADGSLLPVKAATVDVVITLSEMPKEFKKDHIEVSNATHGDPVAVTPRAQETVETLSRNVLATSVTLTPLRGLYDPTDGRVDNADTPDVDESLGIHAAINASSVYMDPGTTSGADPVAWTLTTTDPGNTADTSIPPKAEKMLSGDETARTFNTDVIFPVGTDRSIKPTAPNPGDFNSDVDYAAALDLYEGRLEMYNAYNLVATRRKAYDDAVAAEKQLDADQQAKELAAHGEVLQVATGRSSMIYPYVLTITPKYENKNDIVVKVKAFEDQGYPTSGKYRPPTTAAGYKEGRHKLTIKVGKEDLKAKALGLKFALPKDKVIPAGGYLVVAEDKAGSDVHVPAGAVDKTPTTHERNEKERLYNVIDDGDLPNLETHLSNGGIIDVMGPHGLVISEIMWGSDRSLDDPGKSQWVELYNAGAEYKTQDGDNTTYLVFYDGTDTLPAMSTVHDRVGTTDALGLTWSLVGKGLSGRTAEKIAGTAATVVTSPIVSMYRMMTAGTPAPGRVADSWKQSTPPSTNFESNRIGVHIGTPGAATVMSAAERLALERAAKAKADAATAAAAAATQKTEGTGTVPENGNVYISEVMFAGGGRLPQWIEIANGSRSEEVNLSGWTLTVDNASTDAGVSVGASITLTIPAGTKIGMFGQNDTPSTVLVVTEAGRTNMNGEMAKGQVLNLWESNQDDLILGGVSTRRYSLLSSDAFLITLAPPAPTKTTVAATASVSEKAAAKAADTRAMLKHRAASDMAGNLSSAGTAAWALPMSEGGARSSIIRRHIEITRGPAEPEDGMMMDGWVLSADTSFAQPTHLRAGSYYGAANDQGTPGFRAGGALPVELSHFSPARDRVTDAVVITWATESELNNAGFFIKRSQQRDGEFKVVNAAMIPGAGTTSEKQFYTYTDTTAQPNVVYYYQIEDVSLDGNRQTLTRGIRLKGHVGAAGKATTLWGELKTSHE